MDKETINIFKGALEANAPNSHHLTTIEGFDKKNTDKNSSGWKTVLTKLWTKKEKEALTIIVLKGLHWLTVLLCKNNTSKHSTG